MVTPGGVKAWIAAGIAALGTACGSEGECEQHLRPCDIGDASCREHVFVQTACAREFDGRDVPEVHTITRDELVEILQSGGEPTPEDIREDRQLATALRMLGLLPVGADSHEDAVVQSYAESVLAFYSREDRSVTIVETNLGDADDESAVFVLAHEFVHAQQDVDIGLQDYFDEHVSSTDTQMAIRALTEGEAVHYSNLVLVDQPGFQLSKAGALASYREQQEELRESVRLSDTSFTDIVNSFPYAFGGELVTRTWFEKGGTEAVLGLYDAPPASANEVMNSDDAPSLPTLAIGELPDGWSVLAEDTFGAWVLYAFGRRAAGRNEAEHWERSWDGDRVLVLGGPTEAEVVVAWRIRGGGANDIFFAVPELPFEGVRTAELNEDEVTIVAAPDQTTLDAWRTRLVTAEAEVGEPRIRRDGVRSCLGCVGAARELRASRPPHTR